MTDDYTLQPRSIENNAIDTYRSITENVTPYVCKVGDRIFVFDKRPSANMQLKVVRVFGDKKADSSLSTEDVDVLREIMSSMISQPSDLDDLFAMVDMADISVIFNKAMEKVSARPTTESSDSSQQQSKTILTTGLSEQALQSLNSGS